MKVLKFSAPWCGPCQQLAKNIHKFEVAGLQVENINIDDEPEKASHYGVMSVPTLIIVINNNEVERVNSALSEDQLEILFSRHGFSI